MAIFKAARAALPTLPALLSLLPSFACPLCVSAYLGAAASLGLGVLLTARVLNPLIISLLALSIAVTAWSGYRRRRWGPTLGMSLGAAAILSGRIFGSIPVLAYAGAALLIATSIYNLVNKRTNNLMNQGAPAPGELP